MNKFLLPISIAALKNGKHVLCEKPLGRNSMESKKILKAAIQNKVILKTGLNHRYYPAVVEAKKLLDQRKIGKLCFLRCRYGHGGRPAYEKEWRSRRELSGGGELLDQGVHVVDLFRFFAGEFHEAFGYTPQYFWKSDVEDNAFALFKKKDGVIASLHVSWMEWKNLFSFEIFGTEGYLIIEGLGGSYGKQTLKIGRRNKKGGIPREIIKSFSNSDDSIKEEWRELILAIEKGKKPTGDGWDGYQANRMIDSVYRSAKEGRILKL